MLNKPFVYLVKFANLFTCHLDYYRLTPFYINDKLVYFLEINYRNTISIQINDQKMVRRNHFCFTIPKDQSVIRIKLRGVLNNLVKEIEPTGRLVGIETPFVQKRSYSFSSPENGFARLTSDCINFYKVDKNLYVKSNLVHLSKAKVPLIQQINENEHAWSNYSLNDIKSIVL